MLRLSPVLWVVIGLAAGCGKDPASHTSGSAAVGSHAELRKLGVDEVERFIAAADGKTFVFDDNPREVFDKYHLPGATWLASSEVTAERLPADKTARLIFYCANEQ